MDRLRTSNRAGVAAKHRLRSDIEGVELERNTPRIWNGQVAGVLHFLRCGNGGDKRYELARAVCQRSPQRQKSNTTPAPPTGARDGTRTRTTV